MSTTIDERVVEMRFDNKQFEQKYSDQFIEHRQVKEKP